jgi:hypothetical protein
MCNRVAQPNARPKAGFLFQAERVARKRLRAAQGLSCRRNGGEGRKKESRPGKAGRW